MEGWPVSEPSPIHELPDLAELKAKVAALPEFDPRERRVLHEMIEAWEAASGFIKITKTVGIVLAFIVLCWTQWDRLAMFLGGKP